MNANELKDVIELHRKWIYDEDGGIRADLSGDNLSGDNLIHANLRGANLSRADLRGADLSRADLRGADLSRVNLSGADLRGADLSCANLRGADLPFANLSRVNLRGADLSGANLPFANLRGADLSSANLSRVNLSGADGVVFFGPVGKEKRIGYVWLDKDGKAVIRLGCHEGNLKDTVKAIRQKYGNKSTYEAVVKACVKELEEQNERR